jgi:hypothetical protein
MADSNLPQRRVCADCGAPKSKKGIYCKACRYKHYTRRSGLTYNITAQNRGWFKPGTQINLGRKATAETRAKISAVQIGQRKSPATEFKKGERLGSESYQWKGDGIGYFRLHMWVRENLGSATVCSACGSKDAVEWANKSHEYHRDLSDWIELCKKCHGAYDSGENWGAATRKYGRIN